MPQLQNLILTDRTPVTPVNHTFTPRDVVANVGTVEESTGVRVGDKTFSVSIRKTANGKSRATIKMAVPVVVNETINGVVVPVVARTAYVDTTFTFDPTSSTQERKDVVGMYQSAFDPTKLLVNDCIVNLQGIY